MGIREEVIEALAEEAAKLYGKDASEFSADTRFEEDLNCSSVNFVRFSAVLEDLYDMEVPFAELRRKKTFGEAADYIAEMFGE